MRRFPPSLSFPSYIEPGLSLSIMETVETILAGVAIFLAVSTPVSHGLRLAAEKFHEYALTTPSEKDDEVAATALFWAEKLAKGLGAISRILPVVTSGKRAQK